MDKYLQTDTIKIKLNKDYTDLSILDIGGGGEGFIGQIYGRNVIAIDKRKDELEETNNDAIKLVMDGSDLGFLDETFDVVTLFFSLMYMSNETRFKVIEEAYRVLKAGGIIDIWDVQIPKRFDDRNIFVAQLEVECNDKRTKTGYGVSLDDEELSYDHINDILLKVGFEEVQVEHKDPTFKLKYKKPYC